MIFKGSLLDWPVPMNLNCDLINQRYTVGRRTRQTDVFRYPQSTQTVPVIPNCTTVHNLSPTVTVTASQLYGTTGLTLCIYLHSFCLALIYGRGYQQLVKLELGLTKSLDYIHCYSRPSIRHMSYVTSSLVKQRPQLFVAITLSVNKTDFKFIGKVESQTNILLKSSVLAHFT